MKYKSNIRIIFSAGILLLLVISIFGSCKKTETPVIPKISFENYATAEGNAGSRNVAIIIYLSEATTNTVTFSWKTVAGTADAGIDYKEVTDGQVTFKPGEKSKAIDLTIYGDTAVEPDETFNLQIFNIANATCTNPNATITIQNDDIHVPPPAPLSLIFSNMSANEGNYGTTKANFTCTLSKASTNTVSFAWKTEDGLAKAGDDYQSVAKSTVTFAPGELTKSMEISILGDPNMELTETVKIVVSEIKNAVVSDTIQIFYIENDDTYTPQLADDGYITPDTYPGMTKLWSDEFDGAALNTTDWTYELGNNNGWGNNELESYTNSSTNSFVKDGFLTIRAQKNTYNGSFTSARIVTKGKKEFTYGRIDIRARMPKGQGIWPALWMLGSNISSVSWPRCGEIDIMEFLGHDINRVYGTAHYDEYGHKSKGGSYILTQPDNYTDKFHVFTLFWQENSLVWYVDYHKYATATSSDIKFDAFRLPQFFIMNLAVGGVWPGNPDGTTEFPQDLIVDYVRIFQ